MEKSEKQIREPITVRGVGSIRSSNETMYDGGTKKIEGDIYEAISYIISNETHEVVKITSWTRGEGENIEVVEMDGQPLKKEKIGVGEIVKNEDGSDDSLKLILK